MINHPKILITEDDDAAAHLVKTNLLRAGLVCSIMRARDGREAIDILESMNNDDQSYCDHRILVLLDIRMPRMDGIEVLRYMKNSLVLRKVPVIMLTTTDDPLEVDRCYDLGCNFYITKPVDYRKFVNTIKSLAAYIEICVIPLFSGVITPQV